MTYSKSVLNGERLALTRLLTQVENDSLESRETLIEEVWGPDGGGETQLDGVLQELHGVLGDDPGHPRFVETLAGAG